MNFKLHVAYFIFKLDSTCVDQELALYGLSSVCINKVLLEHSLASHLSVIFGTLMQVVVIETKWPTNPKIFTTGILEKRLALL